MRLPEDNFLFNWKQKDKCEGLIGLLFFLANLALGQQQQQQHYSRKVLA